MRIRYMEFISNGKIHDMEIPTFASLLTGMAVSLVIYIIARSFYNVYLHPLSAFPGPKFAAAGPLYEFYYDVIRDGTYVTTIA